MYIRTRQKKKAQHDCIVLTSFYIFVSYICGCCTRHVTPARGHDARLHDEAQGRGADPHERTRHDGPPRGGGDQRRLQARPAALCAGEWLQPVHVTGGQFSFGWLVSCEWLQLVRVLGDSCEWFHSCV